MILLVETLGFKGWFAMAIVAGCGIAFVWRVVVLFQDIKKEKKAGALTNKKKVNGKK